MLAMELLPAVEFFLLRETTISKLDDLLRVTMIDEGKIQIDKDTPCERGVDRI